MLHFGKKDRVARAKEFPTPRLRHQIEPLGSPAREDDLISRGGAEVARDALPRFFVSFRRARTQLMKTTMHIRVFVLIVMAKRIKHMSRFLRRGRAVKVNERMAVCLFAEDREILADGLPIHPVTGNLVHAIICSGRGHAPLYSTISINSGLARGTGSFVNSRSRSKQQTKGANFSYENSKSVTGISFHRGGGRRSIIGENKK